MRKTRINMRTFLLYPPDSMSNISIGSGGVGCAPTGPFLLPIEQVRRWRVPPKCGGGWRRSTDR